MFKDDNRADKSSTTVRGIDRRTVAKGVAWSVPVVIVATAAPAAAASAAPVQVQNATASEKGKGGPVQFTVSFFNPSTATTLSITVLPDDGWKPRPFSVDVPAGQSTLTFTGQRDKGVTNTSYTISFVSNGVSVTAPVTWV